MMSVFTDLYSSPSIIRLITSRRKRWAGHVTCMRKKRGSQKVFWATRGKGVDGRILKMHLQEID